MFRKLVDCLREWFDSACEDYCNGYKNLYIPQLTCLTNNTGIVNSVVHHEGETSAQTLIDLAIADVQARHPPVVHLPQGWILHLNLTPFEDMQKSSSGKPQVMIIEAKVVVVIAVVIIWLNIQ